MKLDVILRVITKFFAPFILLFALYVQFHGDYGPGGGFQAGVIAAAMVILTTIIFGLEAAKRVVPSRLAEIMVPSGVLIFSAVGVAGLLLGENFLNYSPLVTGSPAQGQHVGILLVEFGVLVTVFGTMVAIFYAFAGRGR